MSLVFHHNTNKYHGESFLLNSDQGLQGLTQGTPKGNVEEMGVYS